MKASNLKFISINKEGILYQVDLEYKKRKWFQKSATIKTTELIFLQSIAYEYYSEFAVYYNTGKNVNEPGINGLSFSMHLASIIKHDLAVLNQEENKSSLPLLNGKN